MSKKKIKELTLELKIPCLVHFTRASNLPSIIEHGLYPKARFGEVRIDPEINDQLRLDGHLDGTSLSITFPNNLMFYKYRMDNTATDWVVLGLDPAILWQKDCAFCMHNAADGAISCQDIDLLKTPDALASMFAEIEGQQSRAEQKLKGCDPTDVQAEVLVFDVIEPRFIKAAAFETRAVKEAHEAALCGRQVMARGLNKGYFGSRRYNRMY